VARPGFLNVVLHDYVQRLVLIKHLLVDFAHEELVALTAYRNEPLVVTEIGYDSNRGEVLDRKRPLEADPMATHRKRHASPAPDAALSVPVRRVSGIILLRPLHSWDVLCLLGGDAR
jgi:hypothetical protein